MEIADKLSMQDNCDYGVTADDFIAIVGNEYSTIMSSTQQEIYEGKDFFVPDFYEQLEFVLSHYDIK